MVEVVLVQDVSRFLFTHTAANSPTARAPTHLTYSPLTVRWVGARAVGELAAVCVKRKRETSCTKTRVDPGKLNERTLYVIWHPSSALPPPALEQKYQNNFLVTDKQNEAQLRISIELPPWDILSDLQQSAKVDGAVKNWPTSPKASRQLWNITRTPDTIVSKTIYEQWRDVDSIKHCEERLPPK